MNGAAVSLAPQPAGPQGGKGPEGLVGTRQDRDDRRGDCPSGAVPDRASVRRTGTGRRLPRESGQFTVATGCPPSAQGSTPRSSASQTFFSRKRVGMVNCFGRGRSAGCGQRALASSQAVRTSASRRRGARRFSDRPSSLLMMVIERIDGPWEIAFQRFLHVCRSGSSGRQPVRGPRAVQAVRGCKAGCPGLVRFGGRIFTVVPACAMVNPGCQ